MTGGFCDCGGSNKIGITNLFSGLNIEQGGRYVLQGALHNKTYVNTSKKRKLERVEMRLSKWLGRAQTVGEEEGSLPIPTLRMPLLSDYFLPILICVHVVMRWMPMAGFGGLQRSYIGSRLTATLPGFVVQRPILGQSFPGTHKTISSLSSPFSLPLSDGLPLTFFLFFSLFPSSTASATSAGSE